MLRIYFVLALLFVGCTQLGTSPKKQPFVGLLQVTIEAQDPSSASASARWVGAMKAQGINVVPVSGTANENDLQLTKRVVSFYDDETNQQRFVIATFDLVNRTTQSFDNLTLYAVNVPGITVGGSAVSNIKDATDTLITSEARYRDFQPTHGMRPSSVSVQVNPNIADLQIVAPAESKEVKRQATPSIIPANATVLGYGFVARNYAGGRSIDHGDPTNQGVLDCQADACKGTITLAYRFPKISPRKANPFTFSLYFVVANEETASISQSTEEQGDGLVAGQSSSGVSGYSQVRTLYGSNYAGAKRNFLCSMKTAVPTVSTPAHLFLPSSLPHNPGGLDLCFNPSTVFPPTLDEANALALQPDGKIVIAGYSFTNASGYKFALARYNPDGSPDNSFSGGRLTTTIGASSRATAVGLQADGKIVAAGYTSNSSGGAADFAMARYNPDGTLDTGFGSGGIVTTDFGSQDQALGLVIQSDNKIVLTGGALRTIAVARYNPNGTLDTGFDGDGKTVTPITQTPSFLALANAVAIQPDGKIVVAGYNNSDGDSYFPDFALVRYTSAGALDTSFGNGGLVVTPISQFVDYATALAVQPDGKIVAVGNNGGDIALTRYTPSGLLDSSFGNGGIVTTHIDNDSANAVSLQSDGKILVGGAIQFGISPTVLALLRYSPNGTLDNGFDTDGIVTFPSISGPRVIHALALQYDDKIVVAGSRSNGINNTFDVLRFYP